MKNKNSHTKTVELSVIRTKSKRWPIKVRSDRGTEYYNSSFGNFLKAKYIQQNSRFTDKGPSIAERVNRSIRNLLKKPVFEKGKTDRISELASIINQPIEQYNSSFNENDSHSSF